MSSSNIISDTGKLYFQKERLDEIYSDWDCCVSQIGVDVRHDGKSPAFAKPVATRVQNRPNKVTVSHLL